MEKVWVVNLTQETATWVFSTLEKAYHFMYERAKEFYGIWEDSDVEDLINELHEDFLEFGLKGYDFGVQDFGYAVVVEVDEE